MSEIFTNAATARITTAATPTDTEIFIDKFSMFPDPAPGETFRVSLVSAATADVEIAMAEARDDGKITLSERGLEDTTAITLVAGDFVFHSITAAKIQAISDAWAYYLGAHATAPTEGVNGDPLVPGNFYFNTTRNEMQVWNGSSWQDFGVPAETWYGAFTFFDDTNPFPAAVALPSTDIYGADLPVFIEGKHLVNLYIDGIKQTLEVADPPLAGDFTVTWGTDDILPIAEIPIGSVVYVQVGFIGNVTALDKYTQAEVDVLLAALQANIDGKADLIHTHVETDIIDLDKYTQAEVDQEIDDEMAAHLAAMNPHNIDAVPEAPIDGGSYLRKDAAWVAPATAARSRQIFNSGGTWTRPGGVTTVWVQVQGGGGGGGSANAASTGIDPGGGGGAGGYADSLLDVTAIASATITVGSAGTGAGGGSTAAGTGGGTSSWSDGTNAISCTGGAGGLGGNAAAAGGEGGAGGNATGGQVNETGQSGQIVANDGWPVGASSRFGRGGWGSQRLNTGLPSVVPATGNGAGGGGGSGGQASSANYRAGSDGSPGVVHVWEYS